MRKLWMYEFMNLMELFVGIVCNREDSRCVISVIIIYFLWVTCSHVCFFRLPNLPDLAGFGGFEGLADFAGGESGFFDFDFN